MTSPRLRMTIRRLMTIVAFVAFLLWGGMACHRWIAGGSPGRPVDPFDASEMVPARRSLRPRRFRDNRTQDSETRVRYPHSAARPPGELR